MFMKNFKITFRLLSICLCLIFPGCFGVDSTGFQSAKDSMELDSPEDYRLQPGDEVALSVYREPQLSGKFQVDASGLIRHPLCGSFPVSGLTVEEAEDLVTDLLSEKYLVNPKVMLSIVFAQGSNIVILGEVETPGVHPVSFGQSITLLQLIAETGGFTDLASVNRVTITRTVDGKEKSIRVRVSNLISGKEPDIQLMPNDVIMVPQVVF